MPDRVLAVRRGNDVVLLPPVPGAPAGIATFDGWRCVALLDDGSAYRFDPGVSAVGIAPAAWRSAAPAANREELMKRTDDGPAIIAAGSGCGSLWFATRERKLFLWTPAGRVGLSELAVPGTARIVGVDVGSKTVLLEDGGRLMLRGSRWHAIGSVSDASGLRVRARSGIVLNDHTLFEEGTVRVLPEAEAMALIGKGLAEFAAE
jgi:hypothetical protein